MIVFIFGGDKQIYLEEQVRCIRENVVDSEKIVFVSGPCYPTEVTSASREHVVPIVNDIDVLHIANTECFAMSKHYRYRYLITFIANTYLEHGQYGLFLHGDIFPIATMDQDILLDLHLWAKVRGHSCQVCVTCKGIGHHLEYGRNAKILPMSLFRLGNFDVQQFFPGFVHLDDYSVDDIETCERKLEAFREFMNISSSS